MNRRSFLRALGASMAVGCGGASPALPTGSRRLVSLAPAITETLGALGAVARLVGRSDWCTSPPEVAALPALGSALTPDLERIAALHPDLVLVDGSRGAQLDELRALGRVEVLPWLAVSEVVASIRRLGALVEATSAAEALADRFSALGVAPPPSAPSVLWVLSGEGFDGGEIWYVKQNSLHGGALHAAGGRNAVDRDVEGAPVLSVEGLLALDPHAIVALSTTKVDAALQAQVRTRWSDLSPLTAVREGRVGVVGGPAAAVGGPGLLGLVDELRAELVRIGA